MTFAQPLSLHLHVPTVQGIVVGYNLPREAKMTLDPIPSLQLQVRILDFLQ